MKRGNKKPAPPKSVTRLLRQRAGAATAIARYGGVQSLLWMQRVGMRCPTAADELLWLLQQRQIVSGVAKARWLSEHLIDHIPAQRHAI